MTPQSDNDYKRLFSELVKKQMMILGPDITLSRVKKVPGLTVDQSGEVTDIQGDPQALFQQVINEFVDLSGLIVKKTMESIVTTYPGMAGMATSTMFGGSPKAVESSNSSVLTTSTSITPQTPKKPEEAPPSIADMNLESLKMPTGPVAPQPQKDTSSPTPFSSKEMEDLNKALADLANSPMGSERI